MATASKTGRTIHPKIGIWYDEGDGHIKIRIEGQGLTSVNNDPDSERYHRMLFEKLADVLRKEGVVIPTTSKGGSGATGT